MNRSLLRLGLRAAGLLLLLPIAVFWSGIAFGAGPYAIVMLVSSQFSYVLAVGLVAAVATFGIRRLGLAARFALLDEHPAVVDAPRPELLGAAESLALVARVVVGFGLTWAFAEALSVLGMLDDVLAGRPQPQPRGLARGLSGVVVVPLMSLLIGRVVLAGWANAAFRAAGAPDRRTFSRVSDVSLLAYLVPVLFFVSLTFWKFPVR